MYQIEINKERKIIEVKKLSKDFSGILAAKPLRAAEERPGEIVPYNGYYSFCTVRKNLLEYGRKTKQKWIDDLKVQIEQIEAIQI